MEQHFYRDDFEQMLKDTTEDFRMYPSRKVWHSIYNDLHPDRKWPSFAVCMLLLVSILYVGVSNNNNISKNAVSILTASNLVPVSAAPGNLASNSLELRKVRKTLPAGKTIVSKSASAEAKTGYKSGSGADNFSPEQPVFFTTEPLVSQLTNNNYVTDDKPSLGLSTKLFSQALPADVDEILNPGIQNPNDKEALDINDASFSPLQPSLSAAGLTGKKDLSKLSDLSKTLTDVTALSWIEDFAFHNIKNKKKWKTNTSFQYYVTPSLGYRILDKNSDFEPTTGALLRTNDNEVVMQQAAPGFEAGAQLLVGLSKNLRFKAGLQYNYTNYITYAHQLQHPSQATILMNDMNNRFVIPVSYNSYYANVLGSNVNRLSNTTHQISLPIGIDYKLAGKNNVKWYVGSSIQPSYVTGGNAFLISHDSKNFVQDKSLLRTFNVNSSFETFVSFKTPRGIDINVGPQVRYQLLSTYSKEYTYTEKLYNLGLKIGITKKL